jgi:DNA-binding transcriptional LysR family regulator
MIKLRQIEVFRQVFDGCSVTGAAQALGISQPAVSKHLAVLERNCGFQLFLRTGGRLVPTPEARLLAIEIERLLSNVHRLDHIAQSIRERRWGNVRLACFAALAHRFVPKALSPVLADRPDLRLSLQTRTSQRIVELAINQQIDLGYSLLPIDHPLVDCTAACTFELVCVLRSDHPLTKKGTLGPADLKDEPFISLGGEDRSRFFVDEVFGHKYQRTRMQIEAQVAETVCSFVAFGMGVGLVPPFITGSFGNEGLVACRFSPAIEMTIWELLPKGNLPGAATLELADLIVEALRPYHGGDESPVRHRRS